MDIPHGHSSQLLKPYHFCKSGVAAAELDNCSFALEPGPGPRHQRVGSDAASGLIRSGSRWAWRSRKERRRALGSRWRTFESVADAIVECPGFAVALVYVLNLPVRKYSVQQRPESSLDWDRKAWSMLGCDAHGTTKSDIPIDPGNAVLARCTQALMRRTVAVEESRSVVLCEQGDAQCAHLLAEVKGGASCVDIMGRACDYVQEREQLMHVQPLTSGSLEAMGDVMEALIGICHNSCPYSQVIQEHLASESGVAVAEFAKVGDLLTRLVRCCWCLSHDASCARASPVSPVRPQATVQHG